ncbi:MAG: hypothetical protein JWM95_1792 [Gemmatimonadetes bacterium]|nr:hypothetical protein [Gemmatimonadota bacterium]
MATKAISLQNIPQGWYMAWTMNSQAANNICVTLSDSATTYVSNVCKASTNFMPPLSTGFQQVAGTNMQLQISIATTDTIQTVLQPYSVPTPTGLIVGQGYTVLLEDSTDNDFNDLFVSIIAWKSQG